MSQSPSLDSEKTGHEGKVIFFPPRFYKPKTEWTQDDWREDWTAHIRHRRNSQVYRARIQARYHPPEAQHSVSDQGWNKNLIEIVWAWGVFIGLCILAVVLLLLLGHLEPVTYPTSPYDAPYLGQIIPPGIVSPFL